MRKAVVATVLLVSVAAIVAGFAAVNALATAPAHRGGWGWGRGGYWYNNTQVTTSETEIQGVIADADWGYVVVNTNTGPLRLRAPHLWSVQGQTVTWFRLFSEDRLNIGDNVRLTVRSITATRPDGVTITAQIVKSISDLTTGVEASALIRRIPRISS